MKLLICTQKVDENDAVLGFMHGWITEFAKHCEHVTVICLEKGSHHLPSNVIVLSLGKEKRRSLVQYVRRFFFYVWRERNNYDAVFVHMNQEYVLLGGLLWRLWRKKTGLWYAHGRVSFQLRIAERLSHVIFTSTPEGFRLASKKVRVVGQGIDTSLFKAGERKTRGRVFEVVTVGRVSPSKDYETLIDAVEKLGEKKQTVHVKIIGGAGVPEHRAYFDSLRQRVREKKLESMIEFMGAVPNKDVPSHLANADLFVNMGLTGSLDKAVPEAMAVGIPVLTCNEAVAGVLGELSVHLAFPKKDPVALAYRIEKMMSLTENEREALGQKLRYIIEKNHSLETFVRDRILPLYFKKIKILFAIDRMNIGGAPSVVFHQMKHIDKERFEPWLLTLYPSKAANFFGQMDFIDSSRIISFHLRGRSVFDVFTWYNVYRFLKQERFDVVYTHLFLTNLIVRASAVLAHIPVLCAFEHSTYTNKRKWQRIADRILALFTERIFVSTRTVAEFTARQENIVRSAFTVIPNPVVLPKRDEQALQALQQEAAIPNDAFVVLAIGRFSEEKGHSFLIEAARIAASRIPNLLVLIVGHGPLEKALKEQIAQKKAEAYCRIAVMPERAKEFLYRADVCALPSLREGQSIVLYEALSAGVPVVASSLEGIKDTVVDGENGLLFPAGDSTVLAEKLVFLYLHPEKRAELARRGKMSVAHASLERVIPLFEGEISRLCRAKGII